MFEDLHGRAVKSMNVSFVLQGVLGSILSDVNFFSFLFFSFLFNTFLLVYI